MGSQYFPGGGRPPVEGPKQLSEEELLLRAARLEAEDRRKIEESKPHVPPEVTIDLSKLKPETHYWIRLRSGSGWVAAVWSGGDYWETMGYDGPVPNHDVIEVGKEIEEPE